LTKIRANMVTFLPGIKLLCGHREFETLRDDDEQTGISAAAVPCTVCWCIVERSVPVI